MMESRIVFFGILTLAFRFCYTGAAMSTEDLRVVGTSSLARHIRSKRCSCATFLDKECVFFCHLDIIWVNTPERTVSYGLGNVSRKKRSLRAFSDLTKKFRCKCTEERDMKCMAFCEMAKIRYQTASVKVIHAAEGDGGVKRQCKHELTAKTRVKRKETRRMTVVDLTALNSSKSARLLLEKWRNRQHHRQKGRNMIRLLGVFWVRVETARRWMTASAVPLPHAVVWYERDTVAERPMRMLPAVSVEQRTPPTSSKRLYSQ
ncbi:hypothetical protein ACEWY4_024524 [Coilia grayii]|uniref:Endothelin-1 n=1 Tax=Coilia grayii TaxID=363190 RepID=A0ABD1J269_9TELE